MKKIYIKYGIICLMLVSFLSCNNDNEETLFSETPAERIANQNSELLNLLLSETQGYKVVYFPKNDEFGGFTFYMKFSEDGTVQMTSDFDSETGIETSSYEVRIGTTTELIFTTRNHIQKVSNPDYPGLVGTGFKGTSVFQYFGYENGVINFKDIRNRDLGHFSMTPSNLSNFTAESIEKVEASFARRQSVIPSETTSVIQSLKIETDAKVSRFNLNYDELSLHASPSIIIEENGVATINEFNFGIAFTEEGLIISPALEFEGEVYETFDYDVNSNSFIATVNGTTATIFDSDPAFLKDDVYELGFPGHQEFWYFPEEDGVNPLTSPGFDALVETLNLNLQNDPATSDWSFYGFQYFATPDSDGDVLLVIYLFNPNSGFEAAAYWFTPEIADNKLYLNFTGFLNATGNTVFDSMLPILIFFNSSEGLYFEDHGSFESDTANYINLSSTFISADQPNLRVYGLWYE